MIPRTSHLVASLTLTMAVLGGCSPSDSPAPGADTGGTTGVATPTDPIGSVDTVADTSTASPTDTATTTAPVRCTPPPRLVLADIPDLVPSADVPSSTLALFEVDGDELIGKYVRDEAVAEGALQLWQELVLRIPGNQRAQLVQLAMVDHPELAAWVDNNGTGNQVGRYGQSLFLELSNLDTNDADVCAPLSGVRGTYDWTLIHEFGHLRQYADGSVDDFVATFGTNTGDGEGYPEDGAPSLDGEWVSSYAERAGGDEDAAESWTAYVMLDALPSDDTVAADKVRFFDDVPDYAALRQALRVSEPGGGATVPAAPQRTFDLQLDHPDWMQGTWASEDAEGTVRYTITADDLRVERTIDGQAVDQTYSLLREGGTLALVEILESSESIHITQVSVAGSSYSESFSMQGSLLLVERERSDTVLLQRVDTTTGR